MARGEVGLRQVESGRHQPADVDLRTGPNTSNDPGESIFQNAPPSSVKVPILVRTLKLSPFAYFGALTRPLIASLVMGFVLHLVLPGRGLDNGIVDAISWLVVGSVVGVLVYPPVVGLLWLASGRPQSVEVALFTRLRSMLLVRLGHAA